MQLLSGKVALVTGGSRGIGAGIARRLAADGAKVIVHYARNASAADAVVADIKKSGGQAVTAMADLAEIGQIEPLIAAAIKSFSKIDILVNNAGFGEFGVNVDKITPTHYAAAFDLNVRGLILTTTAALKHMPDGGRIINIGSGIVVSPGPGTSVYSATKAAVNTLTRTWAKELGPRQITVNVVAPGVTESELMRSAVPADVLPHLIKQTALGRIGQPDDIADVVAFVASNAARWVTGQIIGADGGLN